jgi:Bardet-Biedl syndrome 2 protein
MGELSSTASFPAAMAAFKETVSRVEAASAARNVADSDSAQLAGAIKASVVRAEDSRLLGDVAGLKRAHKRLADLNRDMWLEHSRRVTNQQELLSGLKAVNQMIQAAAGLRVGPAQGKVVAACRAAIKANNLQALDKVVSAGL